MRCKHYVATFATTCHIPGKLKLNECASEEGVAMIATSFIKVSRKKYIKSLLKNDGKHGNHGKTVMGTVRNACHQRPPHVI